MPTADAVLPRLISTVQAAKYLSVNRSTVHRLRVAGQLPAITHWKHVRFDVRDLDSWIERNKVSA
jgi:excisionase family DNA binding protein